MSKILIGKYEATIYPEGAGYTGAISLGFDGRGCRKRVKRKGRSKETVKDKLRKVANDLESGIKASPNYTVGDAVTDWLSKGSRAGPTRRSRPFVDWPNSTSSRKSAQPSSRS